MEVPLQPQHRAQVQVVGGLIQEQERGGVGQQHEAGCSRMRCGLSGGWWWWWWGVMTINRQLEDLSAIRTVHVVTGLSPT